MMVAFSLLFEVVLTLTWISDKIVWNLMSTVRMGNLKISALYQCQNPGFDIVLFCKILPLEMGKR